jgi:acetoin utilization deacetylase AcuC-like enzyme
MIEGHPEEPARLHAIENRLISQRLLDLLIVHDAPEATAEQMARVHDPDYLRELEAVAPREGLTHIDPDTYMSPGTLPAARRAAGAAVLGVDLVMAGTVQNAFCNVRPPGHHAEHARAMGFCFINNAAVAAVHALSHDGIDRVAVLDFDVHYGNGTRDIFLNDDRVMMCSVYEQHLFPFVDLPPVENHQVNVPLPGRGFAQGVHEAVINTWAPALDDFAPQFYIVSAGFDAHREDELSRGDMVEADYRWITEQITMLARRHARGRIVSTLEGGYALEALARSTVEHVRCLMGV